MKKFIFTTVILMFLTLSMFAQRKQTNVTWMSLAAKGGYGSTMLLHVESLQDANIGYQYFSPTFFVGGRFGLTFGNYLGVSAEVLYHSFGQGYNITASSASYEKQTDFTALEYVFFFRFTSDLGFYAELGPKITKLSSISQSTTTSLPDPGIDLFLEPKYIDKWTNLIFGMGMRPIRTDRFEASIGIRASYGFSSIIEDDTYFVLKDGVYSPSYVDTKTNPITVHGVIELNYIFGYFGTANCGKFKVKLFQ